MKHALIVAHPNPDSFTQSVARTARKALTHLGHANIARDLYAIDWDPRLKRQEVPDGAGYQTAPDTQAERIALSDIDSFIFVYPWWFNAPPAILKGYVDRVFSHGFGFRPVFGGMEPALVGRRLTTFSLSGAPDHWVRDTHALDRLIADFDHHLCAMCGLRYLDHIHLGGVSPGMTPEAGADLLETAKAAVLRIFGATT